MTKYYKMYLDESGIACLTDSTSKDFILTGIIMEDEEDRQLSAYFNFIKRKHNIPENAPFHSFDMFGNKGHERYLSDKEALDIAKSISEFIEISPMNIFTVSFNKNELKKFLKIKDDLYFKGSSERKRDKDIGYEILATDVFLWFGKFLNSKNDSIGKIITESRSNSDYVVLKTYLNCQNKQNFETKKLTKKSASFFKKMTSITFEDKKGLSSGLQIADLISYVGNLATRRKLKENENRGIPIIWNAIRNKLGKREIKKITGAQFKHLLSSARVNKITDFNSRTE